jgi:hypothetical protein
LILPGADVQEGTEFDDWRWNLWNVLLVLTNFVIQTMTMDPKFDK